jgi:hypothetical protein
MADACQIENVILETFLLDRCDSRECEEILPVFFNNLALYGVD